ncbi:MAG: Flp pilus assembly protein CpaB [Pirellulaceae bacterium]
MSFRTILVAILALICGVSAAVAVGQFRGKEASQGVIAETVDVAVAAVEIPRGVTITPEMVVMRPWPKQIVPTSAIVSLDKAVDRTALTAMTKDEPLLEGKVAEGRGLAPLIPQGMRAFTIQTPTASTGVAGFILPGNKVDVLLTVERGYEVAREEGTTTTLLQHVEIIAVGQLLEAPTENKIVDSKSTQSVTLLVNPDQAAKLSLAQTVGTLHLTLRNDSDEDSAVTRPVTKRELRFMQEPPVDLSQVASNVNKFLDGMAERFRKKETGATVAVKKPVIHEFHIRTLRGNSMGNVMVRRQQLTDSRTPPGLAERG